MSSTNTTAGLVDELRRRIADPGAFLPRIPDTAVNPGETVGNWAARAIVAGLEDGTLGYVPAADLDDPPAATQGHQRRPERRTQPTPRRSPIPRVAHKSPACRPTPATLVATLSPSTHSAGRSASLTGSSRCPSARWSRPRS